MRAACKTFPKANWVKPRVLVDAEFRGLTGDGLRCGTRPSRGCGKIYGRAVAHGAFESRNRGGKNPFTECEVFTMAQSKRTLIEPRKGDKRYVRRDRGGRFKEEEDVGRSLSQDRRKRAKTAVKPGQGDRGDRCRRAD